MSNPSVQCASCNTWVECLEDGSPPRFCSHCMARLPVRAADEPGGARSSGDARAESREMDARVPAPVAVAADGIVDSFPVPDIGRISGTVGDAAEGLQAVPPGLARQFGIGAAAPAAAAPEMPVGESCCEDLDVRFNRARVFIEGAVMRFEFDFAFKSDEMTDLFVEVIEEETKRCIGRKNLVPVRGIPRTCPFSYRPDCHGTPAFLLRVDYRCGDRHHWFEANFSCRVYPPFAKARDVIHNVTFQLEADRGSVIDCGDALSYLNNLRQNVSAEDPLQKLIDIIERTPPAMVPLVLYPSSHDRDDKTEGDRTLPAIPSGATVKALTLGVAGWKLHLLSDSRVQMGRNKQNDIMARVFDPNGVARKERNAQISKHHGRIELHGDKCYVVDKALDPDSNVEKPSTCGIFVGDRRISSGRSTEIPVNIRTCVSLGDKCGPGTAGFEMDVLPWTCGMMAASDCPMKVRCPAGAPSCAYIHRTDGIREVFAVVWRCCPLGQAVSEAGDLRVWRQDGGFAWRRGAHKGWLVPGQALHANGGLKIDVEPYLQFGK